MALFPGKGARPTQVEDDWEKGWDDPVTEEPEVDSGLVIIETFDEPEPEPEPHSPEYSWDVQVQGTSLLFLHRRTEGRCRLYPLELIKRIATEPNDFGNGYDVKIYVEEAAKVGEYCYRACQLLKQYSTPVVEGGVGKWLVEFETCRMQTVVKILK